VTSELHVDRQIIVIIIIIIIITPV